MRAADPEGAGNACVFHLSTDACNLKSNQKNLGVIQCSNLCTEIVEYTAPDEVAVCNLASVALPKFVNPKTHTFDFQRVRRPSRTGRSKALECVTHPSTPQTTHPQPVLPLPLDWHSCTRSPRS